MAATEPDKRIFPGRTVTAADFERPLLLTPGQDLAGFIVRKAGRTALLVLAGTSVLAVLLIFAFIIRQSWPFFAQDASIFSARAWSNVGSRIAEMFGSTQWYPERQQAEYGILALVFGTFIVTAGAMLFAVPVSLLTAVFLSDIVPFRVRQIVKPVVELLAAIPSVAYGFFAILVVAPWLQNTWGLTTGANALNCAFLLGVMAIPTIVSVSEDALTAAGRDLREASYALGATRAETLTKVVIPAAHNGIMAGVVLGIMRAVGETMVVWMASGNASRIPSPWWDMSQSVRTLTATIAGDMGEAAVGSMHRGALFALGLVLLIFTFALNLAAERFRRRAERQTHRPAEKRDSTADAYKRRSAGLLHRLARTIRPAADAIRIQIGRSSVRCRFVWNRVFTVLAGLSVAFVAGTLVIVLAPIISRGSSAVAFRGTYDFRKMQYDEFGRGDAKELAAEGAEIDQARKAVYGIVERFCRGIDTSDQTQQARRIFRQYKKELDGLDLPAGEVETRTELAKRFRDDLQAAYDAIDRADAISKLDLVLAYRDDARFRGSLAGELLRMADEYREIAATVDLSRREKYLQELMKVREILRQMFGPAPGEALPALSQDRYGATRWDRFSKLRDQIMISEEWVDQGSGQARVKIVRQREDMFAGTRMAEVFRLLRDGGESMMHPRTTVYWQYFIDDAKPGHFFGGVGPEIVGTLLITLCAIVLALPLGVVAAAWLVEISGASQRTGAFVKIIRTCIDTLAGVPSIVFGLFGLAFFVLWFLPQFGLQSQSSILAGGLTLALLVLPVIIRASEEAIRAVPLSYREAALASGASGLRCFITVTLPAAMPGILTGTILAISRAAGETAPILFTAAVAYQKGIPSSLTQPAQTLSYSSYDMAVGDRIAAMVPHNQYGMVATLVLLVLVLNAAAILVRSRMSRRLAGR